MARSPADGYTVLYGGLTPLVAYAAAGGTVPYDPAKAFTPVGLGSLGYPAFVVNSALGIKMLMAPYKGPVMVEWRTSVGGVYEAWTPEQFADFVRAEHIKWRRMSDDLGIKVTPGG